MWLAAAMSLGLGFAACGGSNDVARPTGPVKKVAWNGAADAPAEEAPAAEESEEKAEKPAAPAKKAAPEPEADSEDLVAGGNAIDLDALPAKTPSKPAPRAQPEPKPEEPAAAAEEEEEAEQEPVAKPEPEPEAPSNDPLAAELRKRRAQAKARSEAKKDEEKAPKKKKAKASSEDAAPAASYKGSDPCRAANFSVSRVRDACASGGRPAAKKVMKDAISKATATGQLLKCSDCHSNQKDYSLKSAAVADLKKWLDG